MVKFLEALTGPVAQCIYGLGAVATGAGSIVLNIGNGEAITKFAHHCLSKSCQGNCEAVRNLSMFFDTAKTFTGTLANIFALSSAVNDIYSSRLEETTREAIPRMSFRQRFFGTSFRKVATLSTCAMHIAYPVFLGLSIWKDLQSGTCCSGKTSMTADCGELEGRAIGRSIAAVGTVYLSLAFSTAMGASKIYQYVRHNSVERDPILQS